MFKSKDFKKSILVTIVSLAATAPILALAALVEPPPPSESILATRGGLELVLYETLAWLSRIFWIVAIFFILYAGFTYLTSAGDEAKVDKAKEMLKYAVIGIAVALLATVLPTLIQDFLS